MVVEPEGGKCPDCGHSVRMHFALVGCLAEVNLVGKRNGRGECCSCQKWF